MALYLIGIGLYDHKDVSVRGLEIIKSCDTVYLEHYTSILACSLEEMEDFYGRKVHLATRDLVEKEAEEKLIQPAKDKDVALLVVGDPFGATTHTDILLRATEAGVEVGTVFNASVLNAVGVTGLELYKFGKTTSIVYPDSDWLPHTPYDVIKMNCEHGLHTLCLLDIKVAEPSMEDLRKGSGSPQPSRFMTVAEGLEVLRRIEKERGENIISQDTLVVGVARLGHPDMKIAAGTLQELKEVDFGGPLHSLIVPGKLHHIEEDALKQFSEK
ncbi:MAG: diphthine synthase [Candidatus Woesearchaeota archaeon]